MVFTKDQILLLCRRVVERFAKSHGVVTTWTTPGKSGTLAANQDECMVDDELRLFTLELSGRQRNKSKLNIGDYSIYINDGTPAGKRKAVVGYGNGGPLFAYQVHKDRTQRRGGWVVTEVSSGRAVPGEPLASREDAAALIADLVGKCPAVDWATIANKRVSDDGMQQLRDVLDHVKNGRYRP